MLIDQIKTDLAQARKDHDTFALGLLTTLLSDINMIGKNAQRETTEAEAAGIVKKFIKGIDDTIALLTDSDTHKENREKLVNEKALLVQYLPRQLSQDELIFRIHDLIAYGANTLPLIMNKLKEKYPGQYDGAMASKLAKELLIDG